MNKQSLPPAPRRAPAFAFALALFAAVLPQSGARADGSGWQPGMHARTRLIADAVPAAPGAAPWRAGIEIALDHGFKTYWRTPGSSGVPPTFDFSRSTNVDRVEVRFPAPTAFEDGAGLSYGYKDGVVLPLAIVPKDATKPVELVAQVDFAVCEKLCIPERTEGRLTLTPGAPAGPDVAQLVAAEARVPAPAAIRAPQGPAILAVSQLDDHRFRVEARVPAAGKAELFAEGAAGGWYFDTADEGAADAGTRRFILTLVEKPAAAEIRQGRARLTLTTAAGAIETTVPLDVPAATP